MNSVKFKEFLKTPKGKLVLALGAMLLSWVFLLVNFSGSLLVSLPSESRKAAIKQEIRKLKTELNSLNEKKVEAEKQKKKWQDLAERSWQPDRDGDPELVLRQKVEAAAKKSEIKLNNLGTVRLTRVSQDFAFAELDVSATTRIAPLTAFVYELQKEKPAIAWRRFSVFTMMRRPRPQGNNNNRTVSTSNTTEDNLIFSGNIRALIYHPENGDKTNGRNKNHNKSVQPESAAPQQERGSGGPPPGPPPGGPRSGGEPK